MHLLLIRHPESHKNIEEVFSSIEGKESLTVYGKSQILSLSKSIAEFKEKRKLRVRFIYSSNSNRSIEPASYIANRLNAKIEVFKKLRSTYAGSLAGISLKDAESLAPNFVRQYKLYRAGLLNSYRIETLNGRETRLSLEKRVQKCIEKIISRPEEDLKIIMMHRSSITATLIYFARSNYDYPKDFYGYVNLDIGYVSYLKRKNNLRWEIKAVNINPKELADVS